MTEEATTQTTTETVTGTADTATAAPDYKAEAEKWKALSRKHEEQAKANAPAAQRLAAIEEAQKSEAQKAADKVTEAERRASEAEGKALRYEVGVDKKVPANLLRYLTGSTKEELEANADQLIADFGTDTGSATATSGRPREALRTGATNASTTETDPNKAINDRIRQAAGRS